MRAILTQPLLWFFLIGILLFAIDGQRAPDRNEIHVSQAMQDRLALLWQTQTGLTPSPAELDSLVNNWVQEEVLYQEALRLGLEEEDSIIRRRLVQKINFIAESEPMPEPETATLEDYYTSHIGNYTLPPRYSFRQLYFTGQDAARAALVKIQQGEAVTAFGETSMLNANYAYRSALELNVNFGIGFAEQLQDIETGSWQGPLPSGFGFHLVNVTNKHPQEVTPFAAIREQVLADYRRDQQENARQFYLDNLLNEYEIVVEAR